MTGDDFVIASAAENLIVSVTAGNGIVTHAAVKTIISRTTVQEIIENIALKIVIAGCANTNHFAIAHGKVPNAGARIAGNILQAEHAALVSRLRQFEIMDLVAEGKARTGYVSAQSAGAIRRIAGRPVDVRVAKDDFKITTALINQLKLERVENGCVVTGRGIVVINVCPCGRKRPALGIQAVLDQRTGVARIDIPPKRRNDGQRTGPADNAGRICR